MTLTSADIEMSLAMNVLFAAIFYWLKDNTTAKWLFPKVQMLSILQLIIAFVPTEISGFDTKAVKLFVSYGFGFDFFALSAAPDKLIWRFMTNLSHHLIVLCTDSYLELIGYSICWMAHLFVYAKYIGGYDKLIPFWKLGNHIPVIIMLQYGYYLYAAQPFNELCFFVCVQMVLYRYIFITACHKPYGILKIEPFRTYIQQIAKGLIILCFLCTLFFHVRGGILLAPIAISQIYYHRKILKEL